MWMLKGSFEQRKKQRKEFPPVMLEAEIPPG
jgi:hypothetical protein